MKISKKVSITAVALVIIAVATPVLVLNGQTNTNTEPKKQTASIIIKKTPPKAVETVQTAETVAPVETPVIAPKVAPTPAVAPETQESIRASFGWADDTDGYLTCLDKIQMIKPNLFTTLEQTKQTYQFIKISALNPCTSFAVLGHNMYYPTSIWDTNYQRYIDSL